MMMTIAVLLDGFRHRRHVDLLGAARHLMALDTEFKILLCGSVDVVCFEPAV